MGQCHSDPHLNKAAEFDKALTFKHHNAVHLIRCRAGPASAIHAGKTFLILNKNLNDLTYHTSLILQ